MDKIINLLLKLLEYMKKETLLLDRSLELIVMLLSLTFYIITF